MLGLPWFQVLVNSESYTLVEPIYCVKGLFHGADIDTPLPQGPSAGSIYCDRLTLWNEHKRYPLAHGPWVHHTRD